jgi:imidazolonepropionase-like amidohydrolase
VEELDKDLGDCITQGKFLGPRLLPALTPIVPAGGNKIPWEYGARQVSGADQARRAAREIIKQGAERLVVYADPSIRFLPNPQKTAEHRFTFNLDELKEIVTQASQAGCFVHAQAISARAIEVCARAGVRSIGCAYQLSTEHFSLLKENGVAIAPNLALGATVMEIGPSVGMDKSAVDMIAAQRIPAQLLLQARDFGIEIICATNAAFTQGDMVKECQCLELAGFSRKEILKSATMKSAKTLKPFCQTGSFTKNNFADIVFYTGNPLDDLINLRKIEKIMLSGKLIDHEGG